MLPMGGATAAHGSDALVSVSNDWLRLPLLVARLEYCRALLRRVPRPLALLFPVPFLGDGEGFGVTPEGTSRKRRF